MKKTRNREKNKLLLRILAIPILLIAIAAVLFFGHRYVEENGPAPIESETPIVEEGYKTYAIEVASANGIEIHHDYIPYDSPRRPGEIREIRRIVIHETDNRSKGATAEAHSQFLTGNTSDITGWHYTVDDSKIYHHLPDNEIAWNAGDQRTVDGGNMNGIGIEMCVNLGGNFDKTIENTAALCAELCVAYDLTPNDVYLHEDFMVKICPHRLITENKVQLFKELVQKDYDRRMSELQTGENN